VTLPRRNVEPKGASFYRSQVTEEELRLATRGKTADGQPIIDYAAKYPSSVENADGSTSPSVWAREGKGGAPVLAMLDASNTLVHSDLNAIVVGPNPDGSFPRSTYPLESVGKRNPTVPNPSRRSASTPSSSTTRWRRRRRSRGGTSTRSSSTRYTPSATCS
jgi:manganese oxidase